LALSGFEFARAVHWLRHGFLNDLQVLSGWLQLDRPKLAAEYLERAQSRLRESSWAALRDPDLEAVLFLAKMEAESAGLSFRAALWEPDEDARAPVAAAVDGRGGEAGGTDGRGSVAPMAPDGVGADRTGAVFAVATLTVLRAVIELAAARAVSPQGSLQGGELEARLGMGGGQWRLGLRLPEARLAASAWTGIEDECLRAAGFRPLGGEPDGRRAGGTIDGRDVRPPDGIVGIECRPAGTGLIREAVSPPTLSDDGYHSLLLLAGA
jgi:hypothetical protein